MSLLLSGPLAKLPAAASGSIQLVGKKTVQPATDAAGMTIDLTSLTGGLASSAAQDDIVILRYALRTNTNRTSSMTIGASEGWTALTTQFVANGPDTNVTGAYKIMGATPDTTVDVGSDTSGLTPIINIEVWRGVDTTTPLDVAERTSISTNSLSIDPPDITPTTSGAVVLVHAAHSPDGINSANLGPSTGLSNVVTSSRGTYALATLTGSIAWGGSGAVDPSALTADDGGASGASAAAICLALRPA